MKKNDSLVSLFGELELKAVEKTKAETLQFLSEQLDELKNPNITYKKGDNYEWHFYHNNEYFYTLSTPVFKLVEITKNIIERGYNQGMIDLARVLITKLQN